MNKYLVTVTVLANNTSVGYIVFGATMAAAETNFATNYPGLMNEALFSHAITIQL